MERENKKHLIWLGVDEDEYIHLGEVDERDVLVEDYKISTEKFIEALAALGRGAA